MACRTVLFLFAASALAGCGSPALMPEYTGCGTDEIWVTFDDKDPNAVVGDAQAPVITQPNVSAPIAFMPKPIFQWNQDPNDPGQTAGDVPYMGPGCTDCCPEFNLGALSALHEPTISGDVYDLQFLDGTTLVYRVITTLQEWTAPDDVWASWRGRTLTLKLYRMTVITDNFKAGPFISAQPITLHIGS